MEPHTQKKSKRTAEVLRVSVRRTHEKMDEGGTGVKKSSLKMSYSHFKKASSFIMGSNCQLNCFLFLRKQERTKEQQVCTILKHLRHYLNLNFFGNFSLSHFT